MQRTQSFPLKFLLASIIWIYTCKGTSRPESQLYRHKQCVSPDPCPNACTRGTEQPGGEMESPVLTAVRQGTAEHGVGQQASWGSACCTVHEAILTVAADRKVGAQLCKSRDPGQLLFLASHSPSDPSNSGSLLTQRKHSLLGLPAASVSPILMECLQFFPYLIPFNIIHHCDYSVLLEKEKKSLLVSSYLPGCSLRLAPPPPATGSLLCSLFSPRAVIHSF